MLKEQTCQEVKPQTIEINSNFLIETKDLGKKNCLHVLHVDDDPCFLEVSKQILIMENNFEVDIALSVDEALKKMEAQTYNAIVSDYEMPLKNGLDFLKELKEKQNNIPFILFTGKGREDVAVKALNLGADRYINKNGSPETVYCELADAIKKTAEGKKSKQLLVASESKYRKLVENSLQGILVTKVAPLRFVFANESMGKMLGYSSQELMSLSPEGIMNLVYTEDRAVFFNRLENRFRGELAESCLEFRAVRKDSSIIWLSGFSNRVDYEGQLAVQGMFLNVNDSKKTEELLRESEKRYRELADSLPNIVFETDINGRVVFANKIAREIGGYSQYELEKGLNITQFLAAEDKERATKNIQLLLAGGDVVPTEYTFVRKNSATFPALVTVAPIICQNKVTGVRGVVLDITEGKKTEEILRKSEARYREFANFLPEIVFETDLTGKIIFFNQLALEATGLTREELENGVNMLSFVVPEDRNRAALNMKKSMAGENIGSNEYVLSRKNGDTFPALVSTRPLISQNNVSGLRGLVMDITERKKAEETIRLSEEKYRSLFENASDVILTGDLSGKITSINDAIKKYGLQKEQVVGRNVREFLSIKDRGRQDKIFQEVGDGKSVSGELETSFVIGKNSFEVKTDPLRIGDEVVGFQTILRDATERKETEEKLRESEEKYRDIFENARDAIYVHDLKGKIISINKVVEEYGITQDQIIGKNMLNFIPKKYWPKLIAQLTQLAQKKQVEDEIEVNTPVGKRSAEYRSNPIIRGNKVIGVHTVLRDITERKKIEDTLIESQQKFKALFSANPEAAVFLDTDFRVVEANSRFSLLFGYSFDEIKGKIITDIIVPDEAKEESRSIRHKIALGPVEIVTSRKRKDGSQFPLFLSGGPVIVEGKIMGGIVVFKDISNIITAQEELSSALAKAELLNEKLNVVGGFTRHDVRNKLSTINGNLYLAEKYAGDSPQLHNCLSQIKTAVNNTVRILEFAKDYEMLGSQEKATLDVGKAVDYAASLFIDLKGVKIVNECRGYNVQADAMLSTIFHNLIDNSLKYGQKLTQIIVYNRRNQNKFDSIIYEDNGVGINTEKKKQLFTKGFGQGTGLGLYLIKRTCDIYGWTVQENGKSGKGVQFVFALPKNQTYERSNERC